MPELPEVETVRRGLAAHVVGRRIVRVEVRHPRAVRRHPAGPDDFSARLGGREVVAVERRGKYLWWVLDDDQAVVAHLGMSGQLVLPDPHQPDSDHLRVRVQFDDDGRQLHFVDQRTFGGLMLGELTTLACGRVVPDVVAHIAADPLEAAFDPQQLSRRMRARRTGLKRALLDQTLVSGIGNIYADEALWRSRLHWAAATDALRPPAVRRLIEAVGDVLTASLRAGGTSFDSLYVDVNGQSGWYGRHLDVYGRSGEPCHRCGALLRREAFTNRSSYRCPRCQRRPPHVRW